MKKGLLIFLTILTMSFIQPFCVASATSAPHEYSENSTVKKLSNSGIWGTAPWMFDPSTGILTIASGDIQQVAFAPYKTGDVQLNEVKKIVFTGHVKAPSNSRSLFEGLNNMTDIIGISNLDTSHVTNMMYMFKDVSSLKNVDLSHFDTSNVINMIGMFYKASSLTNLDLSHFDTSNVSNVNDMFYGLTKLQAITLGKNFKFGSYSQLPSLQKNDHYTGKWQNVGFGTRILPKGKNVWSSDEFMANYNGDKDADDYVWQPFDVPENNVTVTYVDESGNQLHEPQIISGNVGESYDATGTAYKLSFEGYTLDEQKLPTNAKGTFNDTPQTVTYVYKKNPVPSGNPNSKANHQRNFKGKFNNKELVYSGKNTFPKTGVDDKKFLVKLYLGLILLISVIIRFAMHLVDNK